jgi:hypothetical protein
MGTQLQFVSLIHNYDHHLVYSFRRSRASNFDQITSRPVDQPERDE